MAPKHTRNGTNAMATKDDIRLLDDKITRLYETTTKIEIKVAELSVSLREFPRPQGRPCAFFEKHIDEHSSFRLMWVTSLASLAVAILAVIFSWTTK